MKSWSSNYFSSLYNFGIVRSSQEKSHFTNYNSFLSSKSDRNSATKSWLTIDTPCTIRLLNTACRIKILSSGLWPHCSYVVIRSLRLANDVLYCTVLYCTVDLKSATWDVEWAGTLHLQVAELSESPPRPLPRSRSEPSQGRRQRLTKQRRH
jgi:hypothetical protein